MLTKRKFVFMSNKIRFKDILLQNYKDENQDRFLELFMNEELCKFMAGGAFDNEKDAINLFHYFLDLQDYNINENNFTEAFGIFKNNLLIGHFELTKKAKFKDEIEIIFLLDKPYWGKGIIKKIISFFNKKYTEKLVARVIPNNNNSRKMLEKFSISKKTISKFNNQVVIKYILGK